MALNLLDTIRQSYQVEQPGMEDQSSKLQRLLRARSGQEVGGGDIASSSLGEQQAVQQARTDIQTQVLPQAQLQQVGLEQQQRQQEQAASLQKQEIEQGRRFNALENQMQTNRILQDLEQGRAKLDIDRDRAQVNQLAQGIRLQNQQYLDTLQREGQRARLDDAVRFKEQITRAEFGAAEQILRKKLGNQQILDARDQDFKKAVTAVDTNAAWEMFSSAMAADRQRGMYTGGAGIVTSGLGAYDTWANRQQPAAAASPANSSTGTPSSETVDLASRTT